MNADSGPALFNKHNLGIHGSIGGFKIKSENGTIRSTDFYTNGNHIQPISSHLRYVNKDKQSNARSVILPPSKNGINTSSEVILNQQHNSNGEAYHQGISRLNLGSFGPNTRKAVNLNPASAVSTRKSNLQSDVLSQNSTYRGPINIFTNHNNPPSTNLKLNSPRVDIYQTNQLVSKDFNSRIPQNNVKPTLAYRIEDTTTNNNNNTKRTSSPKLIPSALKFVYGTNPESNSGISSGNYSDIYSQNQLQSTQSYLEIESRPQPIRQSHHSSQIKQYDSTGIKRAYTPQRRINPLCMNLTPFTPSKPGQINTNCTCRKRKSTNMCEYVDEWLMLIFKGENEIFNPVHKEYYQSILLRPRKEEDEKQIENDVTRTYPELTIYSKKGGTEALKLSNVLNAIAVENPIIGYVQGINFIVASLMFHIKEEHLTYFVFSHLIQALDLKELYRKGKDVLSRTARSSQPREDILQDL